MRIVWMSWKDRSHPLAGGAETVSGEIMDRLAREGHEIILLTAKYEGSAPESSIGTLKTVRVGNRFSVYTEARRYYTRNLMNWADLVIDEMNTIPFGVALYSRTPSILLAYQLARDIWFYQMIFPLSIIGYLIEPLYLRILARKYRLVATESESTKKDLQKYGFSDDSVGTFRIGMHLEPLADLARKPAKQVILSLGAIRPMKRTLDAVKAFEHARDTNGSLTMVIAGDNTGAYAARVMRYVNTSRHVDAIEVKGRVSNDVRLKLMQDAAVILVTSVKEGWGLIVTEANSQGTPAIVYDVDGLRDSVQHNITGILTPNSSPQLMGSAVNKLLEDSEKYYRLREAAWKWSKEFTFDNSYRDFTALLDKLHLRSSSDIK